MTPPAPLLGAPAHVVVADVDAPVLDADARHHLQRVRRLRPGTACTVTDGHGAWRTCELTAQGALTPTGAVQMVDRPTPAITVAFALTKGSKPELTVQKLAELGVDRIVPFRAARSVVRWDDAKAAANSVRWQTIARGAIEQSRGCWLPQIDQVTDVDGVSALGAARLDVGGAPPSLAHSVVAVGPEGGWDDAERQKLPSVVGLGPTILRAETAALTAGGVLCALRSGLVLESPTSPP